MLFACLVSLSVIFSFDWVVVLLLLLFVCLLFSVGGGGGLLLLLFCFLSRLVVRLPDLPGKSCGQRSSLSWKGLWSEIQPFLKGVWSEIQPFLWSEIQPFLWSDIQRLVVRGPDLS